MNNTIRSLNEDYSESSLKESEFENYVFNKKEGEISNYPIWNKLCTDSNDNYCYTYEDIQNILKNKDDPNINKFVFG